MITTRDIAEELGVAVSTVGRAMADDPRISAETKARVKRVALKLGYVGNNAAKMMRGGSSNLVGLMIPNVGNSFYSLIAQFLSSCFDKAGYRLVLSITEDDRDAEMRQVRELVEARAVGIIIVPTARPRRETITLLGAVRHVQLLRRSPKIQQPYFGLDEATAVRQAVDYLIGLGHRRIAYIGPHDMVSTGGDRHSGYLTALADAGIAPDERLQVALDPLFQSDTSGIAALLTGPARPTAALCGSMHLTELTVGLIEQSRIDVPGRLSVIGYGSAAWHAWWKGGLTSIVPPTRDLATACGMWLVNQFDQPWPPAPGGARSSTLDATLTVRATTAPPPSA